MIYVDADQRDEYGNIISPQVEAIKKKGNTVEEAPIDRIRFPDEYREKIAKTYECVAVRDHGDDYHLSDEELKDRKYANHALIIEKLKPKYSKLDEFILASRAVYAYVKEVAYNQAGFVNPEKWMRDVYRGRVNLVGFRKFKYTGKDKHDINYRMVAEFVVDDTLDFTEYVNPKKVETELPLEDILNPEEALHKYFSPEVVDGFIGETARKRRELGAKRKMKGTKWYDEMATCTKISDKLYEKTCKDFPDFEKHMKMAFKQQRENGSLKTWAQRFESEGRPFDEIGQMDEERQSLPKPPKFKGDLLKKSDYKRYLYKVKEWEDENVYVSYKGTYMTQGEAKEQEVREALSKYWNVRKLFGIDKEERKLKKEISERQFSERELKIRLGLIHMKTDALTERKRRLKTGDTSKGYATQYDDDLEDLDPKLKERIINENLTDDELKEIATKIAEKQVKRENSKKGKKKRKKEEKKNGINTGYANDPKYLEKKRKKGEKKKKKLKANFEKLVGLPSANSHIYSKEYERDMMDCSYENMMKGFKGTR